MHTEADWQSYSAASLPEQFLNSILLVASCNKEGGGIQRFWREAGALRHSHFFGPGLLVRQKRKTPIYLSLGHIDSKVVLMLELVPHGEYLTLPCLDPDKNDFKGLLLWPVFSFKDWVAVDHTLLSPDALLPGAPQGAAAAAAPSAASSPTSMIVWKASKVEKDIPLAMSARGFDGVSKDNIIELMTDRGIPLPEEHDEYSIVKACIMAFQPDITEQQLLLFLAARTTRQKPLTEDGFWSEGEILNCFDADDMLEIEKTEKIFNYHSHYKKSLSKDCKAYYKKHFKNKPEPKKGAKGGKKGGKAPPEPDPSSKPADYTIQQARAFLPQPDDPSWPFRFKIYRDDKNRRWQLYHPILGSKSRSWPSKSEYSSLLAILTEAWQLALQQGEISFIPYKVFRP